MEKAVVQAFYNAGKLCANVTVPYSYINYTTAYYSKNLFNDSNYQNLEHELPITLCETAKLFRKAGQMSNVAAYITGIIVVIGTVSSVLALIILSDKSLNAVTFNYHRAINVADGIYMLFLFESMLGQVITNSSKSLAWQNYSNLFAFKLDALPDFVELIVAWISIERASCICPMVFAEINTRKISYCVIVSAFIVSVGTHLPSVFAFSVHLKNDGSGSYDFIETTFGSAPPYQIYLSLRDILYVFRAVIITVGTLGAICVLVAFSRRKRKLATTAGPDSSTFTSLIGQIKTNQSLCLLQLCESIPLIVTCCMTAAMHKVTVRFRMEEFVTIAYEDGMRLILFYNSLLNLMGKKIVIGRIVHAIHFFLYILFTPKIRKVAFKKLTSLKVTVCGSTAKPPTAVVKKVVCKALISSHRPHPCA